MRCCGRVFRHDVEHGLQGAIAGSATRAKGAREKLGVKLAQLLAGNRDFFPSFFGTGREEFKA